MVNQAIFFHSDHAATVTRWEAAVRDRTRSRMRLSRRAFSLGLVKLQSRQAPAKLHTATLLRPSRRSLRSYPLVR
jgi:hypothetical protein